MAMLRVNPTLDRAANVNALNGLYARASTAPAIGVGSQVHTDRINALNRVYANPATAAVVRPPSEPVHVSSSKLRSIGASSGAAMGLGEIIFQQKVLVEAQQRELKSTPEGREAIKLTGLRYDYAREYGSAYGLSFTDAGDTSNEALYAYGKIKAEERDHKLQRAIDAYQAMPENRRDLYDKEVAKGNIAAPTGYKSEALDRYRKQYGDEKTVGDVKPYSDLTPDYSNLKPDIVSHPDGTVTYEKPDPNSSNIPLVLAPGQSSSGTPDFTQRNTDNQFAGRVRIKFYSPNNRTDLTEDVRSFQVSDSPSGPVIIWDSNPSGPNIDPATLTVSPIDGSSTVPTNRPTSAPPNNQEIPTKPDGSADLRPFNPTTPSPVNSPSPSKASDLLPMRSPQNSPLGNLGSPEQGLQPLLDKLADLANATPAGQPSPFPIDPPSLGRLLDPRVPSTGVGENNPVKATSANLTGSPINSVPETKPPMVSVPTTSNPTKIDNTTAVKAKDQLGTTPQTEPQTEQQKARQCEDPCIQGLHDKADTNAKQVEIKVKVFKACKVNATGNTESNATSNTATDASRVDFEEKSFKVPASESDAYKLLYARIFALESLQCDDATAIATVPEWWALRRGSDVPQLAILFAEVLGTGKLTTSRWTLHVPHYNKPKGYKPSIPSYTKGNWSAILKLSDGTRIVVNASTKTEAQRVTNKLKILVPVALRTNKAGKAIKARIVENPDTPFKEAKVIPIRADFYSQGQKSGQPDWTITLRKK